MNVIDELYKLTEYKLFNDAKQVYVEREDVRCMLEKVINLKVAKISLNEKELTEVEKLLAKQGDIIVPCNVEISPLIQPEKQQPKTGHWIETAEEYYKAINEKGGGVNENTDYFVDDIACSECLAKFSVIDNETERFICCPKCGAEMESEVLK